MANTCRHYSYILIMKKIKVTKGSENTISTHRMGLISWAWDENALEKEIINKESEYTDPVKKMWCNKWRIYLLASSLELLFELSKLHPATFKLLYICLVKKNSTLRSKTQTKKEELYRYMLTNSMNKTLYTFHKRRCLTIIWLQSFGRP